MNSYVSQLFGFKDCLANYVQSSPFHVTSLMHLLERPHIASSTRSGLLTSMLTFDNLRRLRAELVCDFPIHPKSLR